MSAIPANSPGRRATGERRTSVVAPSISRFRRGGFALHELFVVLALGSLLVCLGLGLFTHVGRKARLAQCHGNLGTVAKAVLQYAGDHEDRLPAPEPPTGSTPARDLWWWYRERLHDGLGLSGPAAPAAVFACPDDRGYTDPQPFHANPRFAFTSYVFNGVTLPGVPQIAGLATTEIREPKKTLLVMEFTAHAPLSWHRSRTGRRNAPFYRDAESVTARVDGHVALTPIYYDGFNAAYTRDPIPGYDYRYSGR